MLVKQPFYINCKFNLSVIYPPLLRYIHTYIYRLMNQIVTTTPTIGSNVEEVEYKNLKFVMWVKYPKRRETF